MTTTTRLARLLLLATLLPSLAACADDPSASSPQESPLNSDEVLRRASARLAAIPTVRFELAVEGDTFVDSAGTIQLLSARGELVRPDRVFTRFKVKVLRGVTVSIELVTIGNQTWTTDLITGRWTPAPDEFTYSPAVLFDNQEGIGPVMNRVRDTERLPDDELRGRAVFHVRAVVDEAVIGPLTSNTMSGSPVTVDLWIDQETDDLLRARLTEPPSAEKANPATWTLDLFDHGDPGISVEPPS